MKKKKNKLIAASVGFEADGMYAGYGGCFDGFARFAFWQSSEDNGAYKIRPKLCPLGKYGFDPRCRGWYADGRRKAMAVNGTAIHITSPYVFAGTPITGQSATSPLIDPRNNKHIGQVIVDFLPDSIFRSLESDRNSLSVGGIPIMITPESDVLGHDTVVGPEFSIEDGKTRAIEELLQADDAFKIILLDMKSGNNGTGEFSRSIGNSRDQIKITYAPVVGSSYRPLNSSDVASGVEQQSIVIYSLAFLDSQDGIAKSIQDNKDFSSDIVIICIVVLSIVVVISTVLIVYIAFLVTTSMTEPILQLLNVMKDINSMRISNDDINKLTNYKGSCREVDIVYKTIEMLYKVVQFANYAFFSGDLELAYQVLRDALRLFTRLDNKKAIAVSSNNLGNTMLNIYRAMKATNREEMCGLSKKQVVTKGSAYFAHAIKLGESAYDQFYNEQGWSEECLAFMQFLANRYFNRAIFLLTSSCDNEIRKEAESLGFRDLQITADMDVEIVDQCLEMGFKINRVERYDLMISRVRGLLALVEVGYSPDELFVEDQIKDVYQDLVNAMKNPSHELFEGINAVGRMQQFDAELMKYFCRAKHDNTNAARVAIRMLVEDEYVLTDAEEHAIKMLLTYVTSTKEDDNCPKDENGVIAKELGSELETIDMEYVQRIQDKTSISEPMRALNISSNMSNIDKSNRSQGRDKDLAGEMLDRRRSSIQARQCGIGDVVMENF